MMDDPIDHIVLAADHFTNDISRHAIRQFDLHVQLGINWAMFADAEFKTPDRKIAAAAHIEIASKYRVISKGAIFNRNGDLHPNKAAFFLFLGLFHNISLMYTVADLT